MTKLILVTVFFISGITLSACSISATSLDEEIADQLSSCKATSYDVEIYAVVENTLASAEENLDTYFAYKTSFKHGISYLLILNYESQSKLLTMTNSGYHLTELSVYAGNELLNSLIDVEYSQLENQYQEWFNNINCQFIRFNDSKKQYDFELLNSGGDKGSSENKISTRAENYLIMEIDENHNKDNENYFEFKDQLVHDLSLKQIGKMNKKMNKDIFNELTKHLK